MLSLLKKVAVATCFLIVLFIAGLLFKMPGLFSAVIAVIGTIIVLFLTQGRKRIPEAFIVFVIFATVAILGLGLSNKALVGIQNIFEPKQAQAASGEIEVVKEIAPVEAPKCQYEGQYPETVAKWCFIIEAEAAEHGMDPLLIASVIKVESNGQPEAGKTVQVINGVEYHTSTSGAVGLMQVMPSDGISASFQCINGPCFTGRPTSAELVDPAYNIHFGTQMLSGLVNKWGDIREALLHYGPDPDGLYATYGNYYWYADLVLSTRNGL